MADDRDSALSLAFMRGHPASAARVLDALPVAEALRIFENAPARIAASVMAAMLPRQASGCVAGLLDERALELLTAMNLQAAVSLLRYLPEPRRRVLVAGLPTAAALASSILLGYNEDTLGAWADPGVVMLPPQTRAEDALAQVRQSEALHGLLCVTDSQRRLVGVVSLTALLRAPGAASLGTLMRKPPAMLLAHALLAGAAEHTGWAHESVLPVVEAGERLVGLMSRDALNRALSRNASTDVLEDDVSAGLPAVMVRGYWQMLSGVAGAAVSLLPRVAPVWPDKPVSGGARDV
jgi:Mg/Co/Ni transporter MgtE